MKPTKIACMGDSLTEGYGIPQSARWTDLLQDELMVEIINRGISGDTTGGMLARFQSEVIAAMPTHVIIMGGTNDLWFGLSHQLVLSNYHAMLRHARLHDIQTVIGIPPPVFHEGIEDEDDQRLYQNLPNLSQTVRQLQDKLRIYAADQNLSSIDFSKGMTPDLFLSDGVHPNEAGNLVMMENAKAVFTNSKKQIPNPSKATGVTNLQELIANMEPILNEGEYVFASVSNTATIPREITICEMKEKEGITVVLAKKDAERLGLSFEFVASWITLNIHSSLEAVGLTAAFSAELGKNNISCNVIAGYYHDHIFVDKKDEEKALGVLWDMTKKTRI